MDAWDAFVWGWWWWLKRWPWPFGRVDVVVEEVVVDGRVRVVVVVIGKVVGLDVRVAVEAVAVAVWTRSSLALWVVAVIEEVVVVVARMGSCS